MTAPGANALPLRRPVALRPEPSRFWLRWAPDAWPGVEGGWTDLARGALGHHDPGIGTAGWPAGDPDDLAYVPPGGVPGLGLALVQLLPGEPAPQGCWTVIDLLQPLLARDLSSLAALPAGASAVWPLIPGVTDSEALWHDGLSRLAGAGLRHVQPLTLALAPADRRWIAERVEEAAYGPLFHGSPPAERRFAAAARSHGVRAFAARPLPAGGGRLASNRRLAGALAQAGELWLRCGRPEPQGQALYRAARRIDETDHDVAALVREGHLGLVPWLDATSAAVLRGAVEEGSAPLLAELEEEYAAGGPA